MNNLQNINNNNNFNTISTTTNPNFLPNIFNLTKKYSLNKDEESLLKIAIDEYNDLFPNLLNIHKKDFISNLEKFIIISLKNIHYSSNTFKTIISIIQKDFYEVEFSIVNELMHNLKEKNCIKFIEKNYIPHCNKTTTPLHNCGHHLYNLNNYEYFLCLNCKKIYHPNSVLLLCNVCEMEYYSKIESIDFKDNENVNSFKPATWEKYHCNAFINDIMKCPNCKDVFYINVNDKKKLFCMKCDYSIESTKVKWNCLICNKVFYSEAKIYNPLEFKIMKITVKKIIFNEIPAYPTNLQCCGINEMDEIKKYKFIHKKECPGNLYIGKLNKKKIVVCAKCHMLNYYEFHYWFCPICGNRFRLIDNKVLNVNNNNKLSLNLNNNYYNNYNKNNISVNNSQSFYNENVMNSFSNNNNNIKYKMIEFEQNKPFFTKKSIFNLNRGKNIDEFNNNNNLNYNNYNNNYLINKSLNNISFLRENGKSLSLKENENILENYKRNLRNYNNNINNKNNNNNYLLTYNNESEYDLEIENNNNNNNLIDQSKYNSNKVHIKSSSNLINDFQKFNKENSMEKKLNKNLFPPKSFHYHKQQSHHSQNHNNSNINLLSLDINKNNSYKKENHRSSMKVNTYYLGDINNYSSNKNKIPHLGIKNIKVSKFDDNNNNNDNNLNINVNNNSSSNSREDTPKYNNNNNNNNNNYYTITGFSKTKTTKSNNSNNSNNVQKNNSINSNNNTNTTASNNNNVNNNNIINNNNNNINNISNPNLLFIENTFNSDDYNIIAQIGEGTFGKIYSVEDSNHIKFAMKKIIISNEAEINALKNEYELLFRLAPLELNLVNIYGIETKKLDKTTFGIYVLMELASCDWEKEIMNRKKEHNFYSEQELFYILQEFIYTFSQLQKQKISHRDIKPQNILVFKNVVNNENNVITHNTVLKIADFGEAKYKLQKQKDTITQTIRGTELYMSPILFCALKQKNVNNNKFIEHNSYKSDVYSLGLCFLLAASLSFNLLVEIRELDDMNIMKMMINNYIGKRYSKKFVNILYSMLEIDEKLRCDFNELNVKINFSEEE